MIADGALAPRSVAVRVLIPGRDTRLVIPRLVADPLDTRPMERLHRLRQTWASVLRLSLAALKDQYGVPEVSCEIRSVQATPLHKLYLLNGTEALSGYYRVTERTVEDLAGEEMLIYDVMGLDSFLFRHTADPGGTGRTGEPHGSTFVEESRRWFDSMWTTIATPFGKGDPPPTPARTRPPLPTVTDNAGTEW